MMTISKGERPPPRGEGKWRMFLDSIVANPNEWGFTRFAVQRVSAKQYASNIRQGFQAGATKPCYPDGTEVSLDDGYFEASFEERPVHSGLWVVWARWHPNDATLHMTAPTAEDVKRVINEGAGPVRRKKSGRSGGHSRR